MSASNESSKPEGRERPYTLRDFLESTREDSPVFETTTQIISGGGRRYTVEVKLKRFDNGDLIKLRPVDKPANYEHDVVQVPVRQHLDDYAVSP